MNGRRVISPRVRYSLIQYLNVLQALCTENRMEKLSQQTPLHEFVAKNTEDLIDLWEAVGREVAERRRAFWTVVAKKIRSGIIVKKTARWKVTLDPEDSAGLSQRNRPKLTIDIYEPEIADQRLNCRFVLQEFSGHLEYGIAWSEPLSPQREAKILSLIPQAALLQRDLESQDFKRHKWWLALKRTNHELDAQAAITDLFSGERLQRLVAEKILDLFSYSAERVREIKGSLEKIEIS